MERRDILHALLGIGLMPDGAARWIGSAAEIGGAGGTLPAPDKLCDVTSARFGAKGDGRNDDGPAIGNAIEAAGANGTVMFPTGGTYRIRRELASTADNQIWVMLGATILVDFDGVGITFGSPARRTQGIQIYGGRIERRSPVRWAKGSIGLRWINTNFCFAQAFHVSNFETGVLLEGTDGQGQGYLTALPSSIRSCKFPIRLHAQRDGWCTENTFVGNASIAYGRSDQDATGAYAISLDRDVASTPNVLTGNKFLGLSLESAKRESPPAGAVYCNGAENLFLGCRYEGFARPFIVAGPDWKIGGNAFAWGSGLSDPRTCVDVKSGGSRYYFFGRTGSHIGGGSSAAPVLTLAEANSSNNVSLAVEGVSGRTEFAVRSDGNVAGVMPIASAQSGRAGVSWAPPTVSPGAFATTTVAVPQARLGDLVDVSLAVSLPAGAIVHGAVSAPGRVTVTLLNGTERPLSVAAGALRIEVRH